MVTLPRTLSIIAVLVLFAAQLFGQRYAERDHTVFHRPAAPAKHQSVVTNSAATNRSVAASGTAARTSDSNRRRDAIFNSTPGSTEAHTSQTAQPAK
jgi:hypothetical protein